MFSHCLLIHHLQIRREKQNVYTLPFKSSRILAIFLHLSHKKLNLKNEKNFLMNVN